MNHLVDELPFLASGEHAALGPARPKVMALPMRRGALAKLRVIKTLARGERGAKQLSAAYGERLLCLRHRIDPSGRWRLTTVEVLVSVKLIQRRASPIVSVRLEPHEREMRMRVMAAGGRWNKQDQLWRLRRASATALGLKHRIVP